MIFLRIRQARFIPAFMPGFSPRKQDKTSWLAPVLTFIEFTTPLSKKQQLQLQQDVLIDFIILVQFDSLPP